jgi:hypothetical protein
MTYKRYFIHPNNYMLEKKIIYKRYPEATDAYRK